MERVAPRALLRWHAQRNARRSDAFHRACAGFVTQPDKHENIQSYRQAVGQSAGACRAVRSRSGPQRTVVLGFDKSAKAKILKSSMKLSTEKL